MKSLLKYDEISGGMGYPSLKLFLEPEKYPGQDKIVEYLKRGQTIPLASGFARDIFTGKRMESPKQFKNDGVYSWSTTLIYYVENYNLRLPKEFEDHVLNKVQSNG